MAKFTVMGLEEYTEQLQKLGTAAPAISKMALYEGAGIVIEAIKTNIKALPVEGNRYLRGSDKYNVITETNKNDLLNSVGITKMEKDDSGNWNVKIGFNDYGSPTTITKKYKKGLPNALLARSIISGTSVRAKRPFVRTAVNSVKGKANAAMSKVVEEEQKKIMK